VGLREAAGRFVKRGTSTTREDVRFLGRAFETPVKGDATNGTVLPASPAAAAL